MNVSNVITTVEQFNLSMTKRAKKQFGFLVFIFHFTSETDSPKNNGPKTRP